MEAKKWGQNKHFSQLGLRIGLSYKTEFEKDSIWSPSEAVYQKQFIRSCLLEASHQKLFIWRSLEVEEWNIQVVKCCYSHVWDCRRNEGLEQRLIQRNLKALDAYPLKNKDIVQLYNHYSTTPLFMSGIEQHNSYMNAGVSLLFEWIWNCSFTGQ